MTASLPLPLEGIRVLDLSRLVAGNMATLQLADFGADVIKVEQPGKGDPLRAWRNGGMDLWWREYSRNKRSMTLNLARPDGRALLDRLLASSDVLVENFIPGSLAKWGLSHDDILKDHPRLVILSISAWGQDGPYRHRPGFGTLVEAMSGLAAMTGFPDKPPTLPPIPIADMISGLYGALSVLMALRHRDRAGQGQVIDLSLLEPIFSVLGPVAAVQRLTGKVAGRNGNRSSNSAPRNTYRTKDGKWIALSASTPAMAEKLFHLIGLGGLLKEEKFQTNEARVRHGDETDAIVAEALSRFELIHLLKMFDDAGVAGAPVYDVAELLEDAHAIARGVVEQVIDSTIGSYPMHAPLPRMSVTPGRIRNVGPALGEHTSEVLASVGFKENEISKLRRDGVI